MTDELDMTKCGRKEPPLEYGLDHGIFRAILTSSRCYDDPTVDVLVGHENSLFRVHRGILIHHSGYFKGCLDSGLSEAQQNAIELDDEDPAIFKLVVRWMYVGRMTDTFIKINMSNGHAQPNADDEKFPVLPQKTLFTVWLFADRRLMPELCNHVVNLIYAAISPSRSIDFDGGLVEMAFSNATPDGHLRRLLVEASTVGFINLRERVDVDGGAPDWLKDFMFEVLARTKKLAAERRYPTDPAMYWIDVDVCEFHTHHTAPKISVDFKIGGLLRRAKSLCLKGKNPSQSDLMGETLEADMEPAPAAQANLDDDSPGIWELSTQSRSRKKKKTKKKSAQ